MPLNNSKCVFTRPYLTNTTYSGKQKKTFFTPFLFSRCIACFPCWSIESCSHCMHLERHQLKKVHDILQAGVGDGGQLTTTTIKYYNFRRNKFHMKKKYKWRGTGGRGVKRTNDVMSVNVFPKGLGIYFLPILLTKHCNIAKFRQIGSTSKKILCKKSC